MAAPIVNYTSWILGALYLPGGPGGFWTQPDGPGGLVYPQQQTANSDLLSVVPFTELSGQYTGICGHSFNSPTIFRDYDYDNDVSVALITCPLCSCILRAVSPYEVVLQTSMQYAILTP